MNKAGSKSFSPTSDVCHSFGEVCNNL